MEFSYLKDDSYYDTFLSSLFMNVVRKSSFKSVEKKIIHFYIFRMYLFESIALKEMRKFIRGLSKNYKCFPLKYNITKFSIHIEIMY